MRVSDPAHLLAARRGVYRHGVGTFRVTVEVGDPSGQRFEPIEALVDTGATYTVLPAPCFLERLGVPHHARDAFVLADGRQVQLDIDRRIRVDGRSVITLVVFGSPDSTPRSSARTRSKACGSRPIPSAAGCCPCP
jgi:predicted aspartyl protease